jgi:hypothetical protein
MEADSILNELLEKAKSLEKKNENLKKNIEKKKKELLDYEKNIKSNDKDEKQKNDKKNLEINNYKIYTEKEDILESNIFFEQYKNIKFNPEIINAIKQVTIRYISQEQHKSVNILGDFTKWEMVPMKKNKGEFTFTIVLMKGFKYYYSFQAEDQLFIDYETAYEENPRSLQPQNYIDLTTNNNKPSQQFDFENDMDILKIAQTNYSLSKIKLDEDEIKFLDKFKRHMKISKNNKLIKYQKFLLSENSINDYYEKLYKIVNPSDIDTKFKNAQLYFKKRILCHYIENESFKEGKYKYYYSIEYIANDFTVQCLKLYDSNHIKIKLNSDNYDYYNEKVYYYPVKIDNITNEPLTPNSKLYHLLPKEEGDKILKDYENDQEGILKVYFSSLKNLSAETNKTGYFSFLRNFPSSTFVTPKRVEPNHIKVNDYQYFYSMNKITKVKNMKDGSLVQFYVIDEEQEERKKPTKFKIYYCIKNKETYIIHCHVLDEKLKNIKLVHQDLGGKGEYLNKIKEESKNRNELILVIDKLSPYKLYFKGEDIKFESNLMEENRLYQLNSPNPDSLFNKYYMQIENIGDMLLNDIFEQCDSPIYYQEEMSNAVDIKVCYDNAKQLIVEPMKFAVSPCLLKKLSTFEENGLRQKNEKKNVQKIIAVKNNNVVEMELYYSLFQKMAECRQQMGKIDTLKEEEKKDILKNLNVYNETIINIINFLETNERWEQIPEAVSLEEEIQKYIDILNKKLNFI